MPTDDDIEIRSEEVQEIISHTPAWLIRWGISTIFLVIGATLIVSWFVKYPDVIKANLTLTTEMPPAPLVAITSGSLRLWVADADSVKKDDYLGYIDNPADIEDVLLLMKNVKDLKTGALTNAWFDSLLNVDKNLILGDLQNAYLAYLKALQSYKLFNELRFHEKGIAILNIQISHLKNIRKQLDKKLRNQQEKVLFMLERSRKDSLLYEQKVMTEKELEISRANYLEAEISLENARADTISNKRQILEIQNRLVEHQIQQQEEKNNFENDIRNAFNQLEKALDEWEQNYLLRSSIDGRVSFTKFWSDNQFVRAGDNVFTIIPYSQAILGRVIMPVAGSGKVKRGQKVNIRFTNYPHNEYGTVKGRVKNISLVPDNNEYTIQVDLPQGLVSTYNIALDYKPEMQGEAEIITKDLRLLQRIFNQFRAFSDDVSR